MQELDEDSVDEELEPEPWRGVTRRRVAAVFALVLVVVLLAVVPPLINVERYQRRIATSISASLGRPVHIGSVHLTLLPMPGFTLDQFVVGDDPAFGAEPVIQANDVRATLRVSSLWRGKVEFSRISLDDPSVNLVHRPDGRWNLESIVLQAARMPASPTAQRKAGGAPRFPYIEATGARVNVKMGLEKMPFSLTDAEFALWLPNPGEWRVRLKGTPSRTDTAATDTGVVRLEGSLGRATTLEDVPVDMTAEWSSAPLGAVSWVVMGRDAGFRGELTARAHLRGTMGESALETRVSVEQLRRADFVPGQLLNGEIGCSARVVRTLHGLEDLRCGVPLDGGGGVTVTGAVPDLRKLGSAELAGRLDGVPMEGLLDFARIWSPRIAAGLAASGKVGGEVDCCGGVGLTGAAGDGTVVDAGLTGADGRVFGAAQAVSWAGMGEELAVGAGGVGAGREESGGGDSKDGAAGGVGGVGGECFAFEGAGAGAGRAPGGRWADAGSCGRCWRWCSGVSGEGGFCGFARVGEWGELAVAPAVIPVGRKPARR